jgi:hypothetical protein
MTYERTATRWLAFTAISRSLVFTGIKSDWWFFLFGANIGKITQIAMAITDYIAKEALMAEGFIHVSDTDAVMAAAFGNVPDMIDRRMTVIEIARWLQVSPYRLKGYIADNERLGVRILDRDGRLSLRQIVKIDWSRLRGQHRTPKLSGSNFQGRKRKTNNNR